MTIASIMIYKKRMHQVTLFLVLVLCNTKVISTTSTTTTATTSSSDATSQNAVKRFNLQDLLGQQGMHVNGGDKDSQISSPKTQTIDVAELLAAAQKAASNQQIETKPKVQDIVSKFAEPKKSVDIDITADKNGNLNLADIPGLSPGLNHNPLSINDLQSLFKQKQMSQELAANNIDSNNVVREEINLGKQKLEIETAGKRATRYTLAKGPDGGLNLIPLVEDDSPSPGRGYEFMQPKEYEEKGRSRQQMQLTTLSQALYSPFPSEANILHLHLKGKDGKDGKSGNKGPMGPIGPKGPDGPKGSKGDAGTCSSQINGLFECTPDELDSLSNRVDYLEKICKKVENAAKKHNLVHSTKINKTSSSAIKSEVSSKSVPAKKEESISSERTEKVSPSIKEKASIEIRESSVTKEKEPIKEKESSKEREEIKDKDIKEEATARLKEKETLKLEKEIEENGVTRAKKENDEKPKEIVKEEVKVKEKEKTETDEKKEKVVETKEKETEKVKEKEDSKESKEEAPTEEAKSPVAEKKDDEPVRKMNKDGQPPTARSLIDIKAKLKIAELDLMDRVNQAKETALKSS